MNDTSLHDTSGGAGSANTVRGRFGNAEGPSESHYIFGPLQKASGPGRKKRIAMHHFRDTHNIFGISDIGVSVVAGVSSAPKNLLEVSHSTVSPRHGSRILLALDRHVRSHVLAERFGAPPNGSVWTSVPFRCR